MASDESRSDTYHTREMQLAQSRKREWLDRRGTVVTWLLEPWPLTMWLGCTWAGILTGLVIGVLIGVVLVGA